MKTISNQSSETIEGPINSEEGMIFSIQRFSLQDGPGIRTTVFLKGCPLRCKWCSNPESQNLFAELTHRSRNCRACGACAEVCERGAIQFENGVPRINRALCSACSACVDVCPGNALEISGMKKTISEIADEVVRDVPFYKNSGGGVTISGGEPLFQGEFSYNLLKTFKNKGLHTCFDTSGYGSWDKLDRIIDYADLVLFDIKHIDDKLHLRETGKRSKLILENLRKLVDSGKTRVWVRIPVIPGFNDADSFYINLADSFCGNFVEKVSLLGYHEWGKTKYNGLGRAYPLNGTKVCSSDSLESIKKYLEKKGVNATIDY